MEESEVKLTTQFFFQRIAKLYKFWKDTTKNYDDIDVLSILNGKEDQEAIKIKTSAIFFWLLGFDFTDTLLLITKKNIIFLASTKKLSYLEQLKQHEGSKKYNIILITKNPQNNVENFNQITKILKTDTKKDAFKFGSFLKEKQVGNLANEYEEWIKKLDISRIDISSMIQDVLVEKDNEEIQCVRKAGQISTHIQEKLIEEVERIIDEELQLTHHNITKKIEEIFENESEIKFIEKKFNADRILLDFSYSPIIQSGGKYDLKPTIESDNQILSYDTIICSVGMKYTEYNSNIVRTLFIDPTNEQKQTYQILNQAHNIVLNSLVKGASIKSVYEKAYNFIQEKNSSLLENILSYFGYGIGLEFKESIILISNKTDKIVEAGMCFNVMIGANNLQTGRGYQYAILIADTLIVTQSSNEITTQAISKKFEDVSYSLGNPPEQNNENPTQPKINQAQSTRVDAIRNLRSNVGMIRTMQTEEERHKHQKDILNQKQKELEERLKNGNFGKVTKETKGIDFEQLVAYKSVNDIPKDIKKNQIYVDMKNLVIIIPFQGSSLYVHGATVKNVSKNEDGQNVTLRINFHQIPNEQLKNYQNLAIIKEMTFKSINSRNLLETFKKIKDLQKKVKEKLQQIKESDEFRQQDSLITIKGRRPALQDLKIRPNIAGKKSHGTLECHQNGFRYTTTKNEKIDIIFNNIKHAIYQPCDGEMILVVHFNLKTPLMIGKKKTYDVQFYTEAGIQTEDLDFRRRADYDEDEQEERERALRKKLNTEFEQFVRASEEIAKDNLIFDIPYRELGFYGSPNRASVFLVPTLNCLVNIIETPFFIISLDEVETAHFERIQFGLKNFDLCFVFRDYTKPVVRISVIPIEYLEQIKNWLDKIDILFSEGTINLNWTNVMNTIKDDPPGFVEGGGWNFLQESDDESGGAQDEIEEGDSAFTLSEDEVQEEETESEYSEEDLTEGESESQPEDDEELEEEAMDWDEMEEQELLRETERFKNKPTKQTYTRDSRKSSSKPQQTQSKVTAGRNRSAQKPQPSDNKRRKK